MPRKTVSFSDLLNPPEANWPMSGDRLFMPAPDFAAEADIRADALTRNIFLTDGYKGAADTLVDQAIEDEIARAGLIYPILFCYRQFIELSLKWQIQMYGPLCSIPAPRYGHDLNALLEDFQKLCHSCDANDEEALAAVSGCIQEFAQMDPNSFTFRYAADKRGHPYPVIAERIDLSGLKKTMDRIASFFAGCDGYFADLAGAQPIP